MSQCIVPPIIVLSSLLSLLQAYILGHRSHVECREQLVSQLGQATADEVFALRATSSGPVTPSSAPVQSPLADPAAEQAPIATPSTDQLEPLTTAQPGPDTVQQDSVEAQASSPGDIQQAVTSQQAPSAGTASVTTKGTSDVRSNNAGASIGGLQQASTAQRKTAGQAAVASVPSNPRFAPKPVAQSVAEATVSGEGPEGPSSIVEGE